jgi:hypothetical protein
LRLALAASFLGLTLIAASCGSGNSVSPGGDAGPREASSPGSDAASHPPPKSDGGAVDAPPADAPAEAMTKHVNADVCGYASGKVAWTGSIPATSSVLALSDVAVGPTNDVVVGDRSGSTIFEQHRWDESGTVVSAHQDMTGDYPGPFWTSNLFVDAENDVFYGTLMTGLVKGTDSESQLTFNVLSPAGTVLYNAATTASMPTSDGKASVLMFTAGDDPGGGLHGPLTMADPQYFPAGVYCYPSTLSSEATSAQSVTAMLTAKDYEWPSGGNLYLTHSVSASANLGCSEVTVPAAGGIILAELSGGGSCTWNKLLNLPTAAVSATNFRVGADGSLTLAVVYTGSIDFGGSTLENKGTNALAFARFDGSGNLMWAQSYSGAGSTFELGSLDINASGTMVITSGYRGTVNLGGGALPGSADTFIAVFDMAGNFKWNQTVTVGKVGGLEAAVGACGVAVATNSPSVSLGTGPLSVADAPMAPTIGVADLGL